MFNGDMKKMLDPKYGLAWNQPAFLLEAVLRRLSEGALPDELRIIPHIGHASQPEIVASPLNEDTLTLRSEDRDKAIYVNVRPENRLHWLYPLFRQAPRRVAEEYENSDANATPPPSEKLWREPGSDAELRNSAEQMSAALWKELFEPNLTPTAEEDASYLTHNWLVARNSEWTDYLGFHQVEKGWVLPGNMTPVQWLARLLRDLHPQLAPTMPDEAESVARPDLPPSQDNAVLLAEKIFTIIFMHLAEVDMLEGVAYPADWTLDLLSNSYFDSKPDTQTKYSLDIKNYEDANNLLKQIWTTNSAWINKRLEQNGLVGGLSLDDVLLRLMQDWSADDFLGLTAEDWHLFPPEAQGVLWSLLLKRREMSDWGALFDRAVRLLVSEGAGIHLQSYQGVDCRLETPLAQLGLTMLLDGETMLHSPDVVVYLPHDRSQEADAGGAHLRLQVLGRLFLPAHVPLLCRWAVDFAVLDETAWLEDGGSPKTREGFPLRSVLAI